MFLAAASLAGCASVEHGRVLESSEGNPFVTAEAGIVYIRGGLLFARYVVDPSTETCWLMVGNSVAPMRCCAARRVPALSALVTWADDETCRGREGASPAPSPGR